MNSVVLIGMPGAGKSTLGVMLAKELGLDFVDTDIQIQHDQRCLLQEIVDTKGHMVLRDIEEQTLLNHQYQHQVVATGGSVVYGEAGMRHLATFGKIIFLDVSLDELRRRIHNYESRGIAKSPEQSFQDLFDERNRLYQKYADVVIACHNETADEIVAKIINYLK